MSFANAEYGDALETDRIIGASQGNHTHLKPIAFFN
jgi:hypothetical protein